MFITSTFATPRLRIPLVCCAIVMASFTQNAIAARAPAPLEQLVRSAEVVAVVYVLQVEEKHSDPDFEIAKLEIQNLIKAPTSVDSRASIEVQFPSQSVPSGSSRFVVAGDQAEYVAGEHAIVFLKSEARSRYYVTVQGGAGKYPIEDGRIGPDNIKLDDFVERVRELLVGQEGAKVD